MLIKTSSPMGRLHGSCFGAYDMRCFEAEIFEIVSRWKEGKIPLQLHHFGLSESVHIPRGFITACSRRRFYFIPMCPEVSRDEPISFDITSAEGEYGERSRSSDVAQSHEPTQRGGIL